LLAPRDKVRDLLAGIEGLELVPLQRPDECCGFGGAFSIDEEAISCRMGRDRIADHERAGAEIIAAGDMSCLMHLQGLLRRDQKPLRVLHLAELLADAEGHNRIVHAILRDRRVTRLVKSKSMLTEECHLNPYLIERGIEVVDTDLGERIVQLAKEPPSHIVMPAIHKKKEEIGELFHE